MTLFHFDPLSGMMLAMILYMGLCIGRFSKRYMSGDLRLKAFFTQLFFLVSSVSLLAVSDHIIVFYLSWMGANALLVRMMMHKTAWKAARQSGLLAAKNYALGGVFLALGLLFLYQETRQVSISKIIQSPVSVSPYALGCLLLAALTQSALWPFHKWLASSLNSPTPVSAMMHAGLVNGGGFVLARLAPLYLESSSFLSLIFVLGIISATLGTLWKLVQSDVKRNLACSTIGQMGFMLAQCGLGLFSAALTHLVMHGLFKAYLFLSSSSAAQETKRFTLGAPQKGSLFIALLYGIVGATLFGLVTGESWRAFDTSLVLLVMTCIATAQMAYTAFQIPLPFKALTIFLGVLVMSAGYGLTLAGLMSLLSPMQLMQPQPLHPLYLGGLGILVLSWALPHFFSRFKASPTLQSYYEKAYVVALNTSQPDPSTVTSLRSTYKYK